MAFAIIKSAMPNDGDLFELFAQWVPDEGVRRRILVDNPARLYDY
jgi:2-pyrone-4,6-dicarboxylate lactonase